MKRLLIMYENPMTDCWISLADQRFNSTHV